MALFKNILILAALGLNAAACGYASTKPSEVVRKVAKPAQKSQPKLPNTAGTDGADDRPVRKLTESDRFWLQQAGLACKSRDFRAFFSAFGGSWAVRQAYTADRVRFGLEGMSREMPGSQYLDQNNYPLGRIDYLIATAQSISDFEAKSGSTYRDLVYVDIEFNTASDDRRRVDWTPGLFESQLEPPPSDLGESKGRMVRQLGDGGYLLFYPTSDCWKFVSDIQNQPLAAD